MPGTGIPHGTICLCPRYAMPDTDLPYGAICQRSQYTMSGTDLARCYQRVRTGRSSERTPCSVRCVLGSRVGV
eukprot:3933871-Rhodomonas_salina.2